MNNLSFTMAAMPVPLHACFINVRRNGRADSARYADFKREVDADLVRTFPGNLGTPYKATFTGPIRVEYFIRRPDRRARDLDNLLKSLNDTLVRNHIIKDDSDIVDLRIRWAIDWAHPVFVEITAVKDAA